MEYVLIAVVMLWTGWKLGRKYQDFQDIMLARRVAKLVDQREQLTKERENFDRWERQDKRYQRAMGVSDDDRSISGATGHGQNVPHDADRAEAYEERHSGIR